MAEQAVIEILALVMSAIMVITSLIIIYPLVAYARNVAYTEGFVSLALAFFTITGVIITDIHFDMNALADVLRLAAGSLAFLGTWYFARDFIEVGSVDLAGIENFGIPEESGPETDMHATEQGVNDGDD